MLSRHPFSVTYPEATTKYTNLFLCVHDQLIVDCPRLDIDTKLGLIFPESINIHFLAERFLQLPFKSTLGGAPSGAPSGTASGAPSGTKSGAQKLSIDFTNTTEEFGCVYTNRFANGKDVFDDLNCNFIRLAPGERIVIPEGAILVERKPIRECAVRSQLILGKIELGATAGFNGPQGIRGPVAPASKDKGTGKTVYNFFTIGSTKPKVVFDEIVKRNGEILDELAAMFRSEVFAKKLADNGNVFHLEGKFFPQLNVIADLDPNIFVELNTSDDFKSSRYITIRVVSLDNVVEAIEQVRTNFKKLKFAAE